MREAFGEQFIGAADYLNTATYGLPSVRQSEALHAGLRAWELGELSPPALDDTIQSAREAFAALIGVPAETVTMGATCSQLIGLVAAGLPDGARVACTSGEFTSVSAPFHVQAGRGVSLTVLEPDELIARAAEFDLVTTSLVQSSDGRVLDLEGLRSATAGTPTRVLLDVTQSLGWLPCELAWADAVVGSGYKWLLCPRGSAWMALKPELAAALVPSGAGWYSSATPWENTYAQPPLLAADARRFDLSPAWIPAIGAGIALPWLASLDRAAVHRHVSELAGRLRSGLGLPPGDSAIMAIDEPAAAEQLAEAGIRCAMRAGRVRLSVHLYSTEEDVERTIAALRP